MDWRRDMQVCSRTLLALRRQRDALIERKMFGEPSRDLLLELWIADREGRMVPEKTLRANDLGSDPLVDAYARLLKAGFLLVRSTTDSRSCDIGLTESGRNFMSQLFPHETGGQMRAECA